MPETHLFVINLKSSQDRWTRIAQCARAAGLVLHRVAAADGRQAAPARWIDSDPRKFAAAHGRRPLPGEYGCYRSHLRALQEFLDSGAEWAVIAEDDIVFGPDFPARAAAAMARMPKAGLIKFASHRVTGFVRRSRSDLGDEIGRAAFGPQGSTACYGVRRRGAERMLARLSRFWLPFDIAVERAWAYGMTAYSTRRNLVQFCPDDEISLVGSRQAYAATKLPALQRFPAFMFRAFGFARRIEYALRLLPRPRL